MNSGKQAAEELELTLTKYNDLYLTLTKELSNLDLQSQDILHYIELYSFNAADGYLLAKSLKDIRLKRRKIKNELEIFQIIVPFIRKSIEDLKKVTNNLDKKFLAQNTKKYSPKILDINMNNHTTQTSNLS